MVRNLIFTYQNTKKNILISNMKCYYVNCICIVVIFKNLKKILKNTMLFHDDLKPCKIIFSKALIPIYFLNNECPALNESPKTMKIL